MPPFDMHGARFGDMEMGRGMPPHPPIPPPPSDMYYEASGNYLEQDIARELSRFRGPDPRMAPAPPEYFDNRDPYIERGHYERELYPDRGAGRGRDFDYDRNRDSDYHHRDRRRDRDEDYREGRDRDRYREDRAYRGRDRDREWEDDHKDYDRRDCDRDRDLERSKSGRDDYDREEVMRYTFICS